ncbi:MAG: ABC transporter permease [Candidatus Sulfotelmatobacter sp.]
MTGLLQDLSYALRQLRKSPGFTTVAVLTLALGIGANTGIFPLVNAVLLKSLPVPAPEELFLVRHSDRLAENTRFSYPVFQNMRAAMPQSASLAAMTWPADFYASLGGDSQPEMVQGQLVSGNYFQTLETYPALGRLLTPDDDRVVGGSPVAVISYGCWERRFGRDEGVVGHKMVVNGMPFEVVGVAAPGFFGARAGTAPDFWLPLTMQSAVHYANHYDDSEGAELDKPWMPQTGIRWLQFIVRARDRNALPRMTTAINQVFVQDLERSAAGIRDPQERQAFLRARLELEPGSRGLSTLRRSFSQPLVVLMAMVALVLLIACANLANLLLARAAGREHEIAVRLSIGASRVRLVRQTRTECLLLSIFGGLLGIAVAYWCSAVFPRWASSGATPIPLSLAPDARVLIFSTLIALLTGIVFGLAPALQSTRVEPVRALKASGRGFLGGRGGKAWSLKQTLVASQVALSLVLLVGAGLFLRTLRNFTELDPGFDRDHILTVWLDTHMAGYKQDQLSPLYLRLIERVEAMPGVRSASLASCGLAIGCGDASDIYLPGVPHSNGETDSQERRVSQHFLATTGIPLLAGRNFATTDTEKSPPVAIVNQTFVHEFLHDANPIGQYFGYDAANDHRFEIVGVVKDARVNDITEAAPPMIYHSLAQDVIDVESLDVRTSGDPAQLIAEIRQAVRSVDPNLPIGGITTVAEELANDLAQQRLIARLTTIFCALALGLACLGLYGVMSYTVARRTRELGVRLALGASRNAVVWLVLRQTLVVIGAGIAAGLLLSFLAGRTLTSLLFGLSPHDPGTVLGAAAVLLLVSVGSGLRPAWRAAHVNPTESLRAE